MDHIVMLLHGTWGRGLAFRRKTAPWTNEGSLIRECYSNSLNGSVSFMPFSWSGANRFSSRVSAAAKLREKIAEIHSKSPEASLHICAHSHGGNIAFLSLSGCESTYISSLVCMSCPFLLVRPRRTNSSRVRSIIYIANRLFFFSIIAFVLGTFYYFDNLLSQFGLLVVFFYAALFSILIFLFRLAKRKFPEKHKYFSDNVLPRSLHCRTLIVRSDADEAQLFLSTIQLVVGIANALQGFIVKLVPSYFREDRYKQKHLYWSDLVNHYLEENNIASFSFYPTSLVLLACCFMLYGFGTLIVGVDNNSVLSIFILSCIVICLLRVFLPVLVNIAATLIILIAMPIACVLEIIRCALLIFFGFRPTNAWMLDVSIESTPPGHWNVTQLAKHHGARHFTHSDLEAVDEVRRWLSKNL